MMNLSVDAMNLGRALRVFIEFILAKNPSLRKYRFALLAASAAAGYVAGDLSGAPVVQESLQALCGE